MKIRTFLQRESLQILLLALPFALVAAWWGKFPPVVATHWGIRGQPNGWMPKVPGLLLLPTVNVGLCLLMAFLPKIDPRLRGNPVARTARYRGILRIIRLAVTAFTALIAVAAITLAAGWAVDLPALTYNGMLVLLAVVGNFMGSLEPNRFVGCRTPWTLRDDATWRATHRTTGRLMVFGALALLAAQIFVGSEARMFLMIAYIAGIAAWSLGFSAWFYLRRRHLA